MLHGYKSVLKCYNTCRISDASILCAQECKHRKAYLSKSHINFTCSCCIFIITLRHSWLWTHNNFKACTKLYIFRYLLTLVERYVQPLPWLQQQRRQRHDERFVQDRWRAEGSLLGLELDVEKLNCTLKIFPLWNENVVSKIRRGWRRLEDLNLFLPVKSLKWQWKIFPHHKVKVSNSRTDMQIMSLKYQ